MSHVVGATWSIDNLECLEAACEEIGLELVRNQKTYKWYGKWMNDYSKSDAAYLNIGIKPEDYGKCEHAIRVKGNPSAYEIGVVKCEDGKLRLIFDFWGAAGRAIETLAGKNATELGVRYAAKRLEKGSKMKKKKLRLDHSKKGKKRLILE